jgi:uncharacterized protein DUF262
MTRQTSGPIEPARLSATNRSARELARLAGDGTIDINTPYQRGDVWDLDQRISLIRSWMLGLPIPAVIVNDRRDGLWADNNPSNDLNVCYGCIDGKQRLTTAMMWFSGELRVPASWFPSECVEHTTDTDDGPYVRFTDLTMPEQRNAGMTWTMPLAEAKVATIQDEAAIYLLVNGGGTPQSDADMDNARRIAEGI